MSGKIFGISGSEFSDQELYPFYERIVRLTEKAHPEMVFLPTARRDCFDLGWNLIFTEFLRLGCRVRVLNVTDPAETRESVRAALENADIIYETGGNVRFLMETWTASGAADAIREAYRRGAVLCGTSAGMLCWMREGWDDCGDDNSFHFVPCLDLLPYCACPHFGTECWQSFRRSVKTRGESGIALENDTAILYDAGVLTCLSCSDPSAQHEEDVGHVYFFDAANGFCETDITGRSWRIGENPACR